MDARSDVAPGARSARAGPHELVGWLFLGTVVNYLDRVNIAVVAPQLLEHTGWTREQFGWVFSAFLAGYALFQIPGGWLADRWNPRLLLAAAFVGFSAFTLLTPVAATSFLLLLGMRFLVGAFEAVTFPAMTAFNAHTQAAANVGRAQSRATAGVMVGQIVAYGLTAWILRHAEWPVVFVVNALFGFLWAIFWVVRSRGYVPPSRPVGRSQSPRQSIGEVVRHTSLLLVALCYMGMTYVIWLIIFWTPTYLSEARALGPTGIAYAGVAMQVAGLLGLLIAGVVGDRVSSGTPRRRARLSAMLLIVAAPCLLGTVHAPSTMVSVACLVLWDGLFYAAFAGFAALAIDFSRDRAGTVFGTMNALGSASAIVGPVTAGYMSAGGNWTLAFHVCAAVAASAGITLLLIRIQPLGD